MVPEWYHLFLIKVNQWNKLSIYIVNDTIYTENENKSETGEDV